MADANNKLECLRQNLCDAKCDEAVQARCVQLAAEGHEKQMIPLLREQRKALLDTIHEHQKALDCLDYLMFQTERKGRNGGTTP